MARHEKEHKGVKYYALKTLKWVGISLGGILAAVVAFFLVMFYTPLFPEMRTQYILMTIHTSNPWLATTFFTQETIDRVLYENRVEEPEGSTDTDIVQVGGTTTGSVTPTTGSDTTTTQTTNKTTTATTAKPTTARPVTGEFKGEVIYKEEGMDILQIKTSEYVARLIRVKDPSRVRLELCEHFMEDGKRGEKLSSICQRLGAVAGINAGGFVDEGGHGLGSYPTQLCVKDGKILYADKTLSTYNVIGFNKDNVLVLGKFTKEEILKKNIRDAVAFTPFLVLNGEKAVSYGAAGGKDPRAAIGQTADGTVLLLTVDGRQLDMIGANMRTLTDILWEYGAVNAANIDGGSSTTMVLDGEVINKPCGPAGARFLPNGWLVF